MEKLETGDIVIFRKKNTHMMNIMGLGDYFSENDICHVGIILKDPTWLNLSLRGTFVWECGWDCTPDPQKDGMKISTQITSILDSKNKYPNCDMYTKKIKTPSTIFFKCLDEKLKKVYERLFENSYSIIPDDWLRLSLNKRRETDRKYDRYWCSGLIAYILRELGILYYAFDWASVVPNDFSGESKKLKFCKGFSFENRETKLEI